MLLQQLRYEQHLRFVYLFTFYITIVQHKAYRKTIMENVKITELAALNTIT